MSDTSPAADQASQDAAAQARQEFDALSPDQQQEVKTLLGSLGSKWWLLLVLGILTIIVGLLIVLNPSAAILTIAIFFGIYLLVSGIFEVVRGFSDNLDTGSKVLTIIVGAISIVLGLMCLRNIATSVDILVLFIGITFIMRGILELVVGFSNRGTQGSGWFIFMGFLGIVAGIVVLSWPKLSLGTLVILLGIWLIVLGVFEIVAAFQIKRGHEAINQQLAAL
jgi:uncharacterized membrane protein HdeD (DUF308 family)